MEEDRISLLPDCLLVEILSRLDSMIDATRTSTLSKRWKHMWTLLPDLIFTHDILKYPIGDFLLFVDKTLTQCGTQLNLNKFQLDTYYAKRFEPLLNDCILHAVNRNVQELSLILWYSTESIEEFELQHSEFFFTNYCFTSLALSCFIFNPAGAISWSNLTSLCISHVNLDEDLIHNILTGSPLLETLDLTYCSGFRMFDITSKSVKNFVLNGYMTRGDEYEDFAHIVEIKAPYILSLTIRDDLLLSKLVLLNVSSLVKATLNYKMEGYNPEKTDQEAEEEMLEGFMQSLRHVKELYVGKFCIEVIYRLVAKGFDFQRT